MKTKHYLAIVLIFYSISAANSPWILHTGPVRKESEHFYHWTHHSTYMKNRFSVFNLCVPVDEHTDWLKLQRKTVFWVWPTSLGYLYLNCIQVRCKETNTTQEVRQSSKMSRLKKDRKGAGIRGKKERAMCCRWREVRKCQHSGRAWPEKHHVEVEGPAGATWALTLSETGVLRWQAITQRLRWSFQRTPVLRSPSPHAGPPDTRSNPTPQCMSALPLG